MWTTFLASYATILGMSIFRRNAEKAAAPQETVVVVAFRDLAMRDPLANFSPERGYAYVWPFAEPPQVGQWAVADGGGQLATVVVGAIGLPPSARGMELKSIISLIPQSQVDKVHAAHEAAMREWLNMARHVAGLPTSAPVGAKAPPGFDPLPPAEGTADMTTADSYGQVWWRAYKLAEELGRASDEAATFQRIARDWYRVRDRAGRNEQLSAVTQHAESTDLRTAIRTVGNRSRAEVESMLFAGKPLWDWLRYVEELSRQGSNDKALELVGALITAAEQESQISGQEPAPAYTWRAAIIYRKQRDYRAEIAVLERWEKACPPEKRGPGTTQEAFAKRLEKARALAARKVGGNK